MSHRKEKSRAVLLGARMRSRACPRRWTGPRGGGRVPAESLLTVRGAAAGPVAGAVPHFDSLPPHFQQIRIGQAGFARVPKPLLVVAAVVGDVDGRPGRPGRGLLQLGARVGVAGLVLLEEQGAACARRRGRLPLRHLAA